MNTEAQVIEAYKVPVLKTAFSGKKSGQYGSCGEVSNS